ncbi:MAG: hypothetical protein CUN56_00280 [Phototrophicales bacterium]|nr:MAG: hypothetical protein CUN56_00280 [Phototrophicales bacterium]RMG71118.1 MAG: MarR family transcriptional regulator [Chloroflexota bacterium]
MLEMDEKLKTHVFELRVLMSLAWKSAMQHLDQWLAQHEADITRVQLGVMRTIDQEGAHTLSDLSRKWGLDPSTLVPTVDALERKRYITKQRDPQDRRRVLISLTELGKQVVANVPLIPEDDPLFNALKSLGEQDTHQLLTLLCKLVHRMPQGEQLIEDAQSRLFAHGAKETYLICKSSKD